MCCLAASFVSRARTGGTIMAASVICVGLPVRHPSRCGLDLPTLLQMKNSSMAALASENGWQEMAEVELQVCHF